MLISVLDPDGRRLHPVPRNKAVGKVTRGDADWVHAPGHAPNTYIGTIQLRHAVADPPRDGQRTLVLDADGVPLGYIWGRSAAKVITMHGAGDCPLAEVIGTCSQYVQPRVIITLKIVKYNTRVMEELRRLEATRAIEAIERRDIIRKAIRDEIAASTAWSDVQAGVAKIIQTHTYGITRKTVLADLRDVCDQVGLLDLFGGDNIDIVDGLLAYTRPRKTSNIGGDTEQTNWHRITFSSQGCKTT